MLTIEDVLRKGLEGFIETVRSNLAATGTEVTGKTSGSLIAEVRPGEWETVGAVYGRPFFSAVETGSRPWSRQYERPPKFFIEIIREWTEAKGVTASPGAIAYTIMRKGSRLYRSGGRTDIYTDVIPATVESIASEALGALGVQVEAINSKL